MPLKNLKKILVTGASISWLVSASCAGIAVLASGGGVGAATFMQATRPCTFSEQLQTSVPVRQRYLVKLSSVVRGTVPSVGAIEEMYSNIKSASYNAAAAEEDVDLLGFRKSVKLEEAELDSFSMDCLNCHDGAGAVSVAVDWRNNPARLRTLKKPQGTDHPIGMDYESYVSNGRDYRSVSGLGTKMIFVNGRVGCLTCHDPMNPEKGHLVMSDQKSALCLTCHSR